MENAIFTVSLYLGISGFLLFIFSFLTGLRIIKIKAKYKFHKRISIVGFCCVSIHALVMTYFNFLS